jgi:uncharacterized membrane protein
MGKTRLEAFSDGVIAVIITIMVLELKVPHTTELSELAPLGTVFLSYVLSYVNVGLYWNNHHHLLHTVEVVDGKMLWANLHFLFWLSLMPFVTGWMGENQFAAQPTAMYGFVLFMCAVAYFILTRTIIAKHGPRSTLAKAVGYDWKGKLPLLMYGTAVGAAFLHTWIALALYVGVAAMWLVPDKRIEKQIEKEA